MTESVRVELGARSYEVRIGAGLLGQAGAAIAPLLPRKRLVIVTDQNVAGLHLDRLRRALASSGIVSEPVVLPAGEATKSFAHLHELVSRLLALDVERRDLICALGGGVIGDLAGFAAAILRRGVDFIQVPTTLLAQVDSSVGGKTGINVAAGKNLIGAFHQPRLVLADIALLASLPRRELLAGYAEVVKYGLIDDVALFDWLAAEGGQALLAGDAAARQRAVGASVRAKARIVGADEKETGARALLNLGHTFGHALEAETGFGPALLHGEAVAAGLVLAFDLSVRLGLCPPADAARLRAHLDAVGLVTDIRRLPGAPYPVDHLLDHMRQDKKVSDGRITFVLARGIGRAFLTKEVDPTALHAVLDGQGPG